MIPATQLDRATVRRHASSTARQYERRAEGSLLLFVLLLLAVGFALVFFARTPDGLPNDALNLNTATADELAVTLEIDPALATLLVQHRQRLGGFRQTYEPASVPVFPTPEAAEQVRAALRQSRLDVSTASMAELVGILKIPRPVARRIVAYRGGLPDGRFHRPEDLLRVPVVDERTIYALGSRLIVRHPAEVFWGFVARGGSLALLFLAVPVLLRRAGVGGDPFLLPFALLLAGFGVMALFSIKDPLRDTPVYAHHMGGLWLGVGALLLGALLPGRAGEGRGWLAQHLPARNNLRHYTYVWALGALLLMLLLGWFGTGPSGVRLSLPLPLIGSFQPVELIKIVLILFLAGYLAQRGDLLADVLHRWRPPLPKGWLARYKGIAVPRREDLGPMVGMYGAALVLFLIVRDLGPALVLFGAFLATLYLATGRSGIVWVGLLAMFLGGWLGYTLRVGVLPVRVEMWRAPWDNPYPNGMQLGQSLWAMASGGMWGSGLGLGAPGTMPRGGSDLVFASLAEELGLIGSLALLLLYLLLLWRGLRIALHAHTDFDRLLAVGLTTLLACQVFLITAGVTGLLPLTGLTLPFVSYGNSALVADFFLLGLLRGISAPTGSVPIGARPLFRQTARRFLTAAAIGLLGLIGVGRLFWIQAVAADEIAGRLIRTPDADRIVRAKVNPRLLTLERAIPRGSIYDRQGRVLATSRLSEISEAMPDAPERARRLYRKGRYYPRGPAFAHLVGYLDPAIGGPTGLEKEFHAELRGFRDYSELLSDYRAKDLPHWLTRRPPRQGSDLVLTLDADLQEAAVRALERVGRTLKDRRSGKPKDRAALVVLAPTTGEVLVSASLPTYDPNTLTPARWRSLLANEDRSFRLVDRARAGMYPPGSALKVATAAAALEEGIEPLYLCNHVATNVRWTFRGRVYARARLRDDEGSPPHNPIRMARAMRVSCNLYFANLGLALGPERLRRAFADRFELRGVKPLDAFAADLPDNAFGQGTMLATPTEMARVAAAVANRGAMMEPLYWREVRPPHGAAPRRSIPARMGRPLGELNARRLAEMMRSVVTDGTARGLFDDLPVQVAGKTGTAQTETGDGEPHSWFIGYTPYTEPKAAFACVIENGGYGKRGAAPAVRDLLRALFP